MYEIRGNSLLVRLKSFVFVKVALCGSCQKISGQNQAYYGIPEAYVLGLVLFLFT